MCVRGVCVCVRGGGREEMRTILIKLLYLSS